MAYYTNMPTPLRSHYRRRRGKRVAGAVGLGALGALYGPTTKYRRAQYGRLYRSGVKRLRGTTLGRKGLKFTGRGVGRAISTARRVKRAVMPLALRMLMKLR